MDESLAAGFELFVGHRDKTMGRID